MTQRTVSLQELLNEKEARAKRQQAYLGQHHAALVSFTLNIAGPVKRFPAADLLFENGREMIRESLGKPIASDVYYSVAGVHALYACHDDPQRIKDLCIAMEGRFPAARLFDMDVITPGGEKLSRPSARTCLICGGPAAVCARSRAHGLDAVTGKTQQLLYDYLPRRIGDLAVRALKEEASLTPKPGLVDRDDNGAHRDMDIHMMLRSADALQDYFEQAALLGMASDDCIDTLQQRGIQAEKNMFSVTDGVNTHKGAIYTLGLLCAALGMCALRNGDPFDRAQALARQKKDEHSPSHGNTVRSGGHACGAVTEARAGFPLVRTGYAMLAACEDPLTVLLHMMQKCDDTCLLYRGGNDALAYVKNAAARALDCHGEERTKYIQQMNAEMIRRNISPGGSADLLAASLMMLYCRPLFDQPDTTA